MLTIGAFSRLTQVSPRMLRYYDAMGLLRPAHVGTENGYRYYGESQLSELRRIEALKEYGFPLWEIGELLRLPQEELSRRIHRRRLEAYRELTKLRERLRKMENDIIRMEGIGMLLEKYHVILMEDPAQRVFSLRRTISVGQTHQLFADLRREMEAEGYRQAGPTQLLYHGEPGGTGDRRFVPGGKEINGQSRSAPANAGALRLFDHTNGGRKNIPRLSAPPPEPGAALPWPGTGPGLLPQRQNGRQSGCHFAVRR